MESEDSNSAQIGQLNRLFHTFTDLVNRVGAKQDIDWLVSNSLFSPTDTPWILVDFLDCWTSGFMVKILVSNRWIKDMFKLECCPEPKKFYKLFRITEIICYPAGNEDCERLDHFPNNFIPDSNNNAS